MHQHAGSLAIRCDPDNRHRLRGRHVEASGELPLLIHEIELALDRSFIG
jgi:hypothetical protein